MILIPYYCNTSNSCGIFSVPYQASSFDFSPLGLISKDKTPLSKIASFSELLLSGNGVSLLHHNHTRNRSLLAHEGQLEADQNIAEKLCLISVTYSILEILSVAFKPK